MKPKQPARAIWIMGTTLDLISPKTNPNDTSIVKVRTDLYIITPY